MKKTILALAALSVLAGCGSDSTPEKFDTCSQVKLEDGTVLDLEERIGNNGSITYGYENLKGDFVEHRDCDDGWSFLYQEKYSPKYIKRWKQNGKFKRDNDKPTLESLEKFRDPNGDPTYLILRTWRSANNGYVVREGDKPNYVTHLAFENAKPVQITGEYWYNEDGKFHRIGKPAIKVYHDYISDSYPFEAWYDSDRRLKSKRMPKFEGDSGQCSWTGYNNDGTQTHVSRPFDGTGTKTCVDEKEMDAKYLVWK